MRNEWYRSTKRVLAYRLPEGLDPRKAEAKKQWPRWMTDAYAVGIIKDSVLRPALEVLGEKILVKLAPPGSWIVRSSRYRADVLSDKKFNDKYEIDIDG